MKKGIIFMVISIILVLSIGLIVALKYFGKGSVKNGTLNINGTDITSKNVIIRKDKFGNPVLPFPDSFFVKITDLFSDEYYYSAKLPLTEVLISLGMTVEWVTDNTANLTYEGKEYVLNLANVSLIEKGKTINHLLPAPGDHRFHTVLNRELLLDTNTIRNALHEMGVKIHVYINYEDETVYIVE